MKLNSFLFFFYYNFLKIKIQNEYDAFGLVRVAYYPELITKTFVNRHGMVGLLLKRILSIKCLSLLLIIFR